MTQQTLKKQYKIRFAEILEDNGILLSANLASQLANAASEINAARKKNGTCPQPWMLAICRTCKYDPRTMTKAAWAQVKECGRALLAADATEEDLQRFEEWWRSDDWRSKNLAITPKRIQDSWGLFNSDDFGGGSELVVAL